LGNFAVVKDLLNATAAVALLFTGIAFAQEPSPTTAQQLGTALSPTQPFPLKWCTSKRAVNPATGIIAGTFHTDSNVDALETTLPTQPSIPTSPQPTLPTQPTLTTPPPAEITPHIIPTLNNELSTVAMQEQQITPTQVVAQPKGNVEQNKVIYDLPFEGNQLVATEIDTKPDASATQPKVETAKTDAKDLPPQPYVIGSDSTLTTKVNNGGLQFETANKDYRYHVGALIQQDYVFFSQDAALRAPVGSGAGPSGGIGDLQDGVFFRRGRIRFDGIAHELIEWDFDCELIANNTVTFDDMWVGLTNLPFVGNVRAGHVKIPMGIESMTSNRVFTFVERAAMFDAFLPEYGPGFLVFDSIQDAKLTWAACAHRLDPTTNGTDVGDGQWNGTFRLSSLVYNTADDRHYMHVGGAYSIRDDRGGTVRFRARPEWRDTTTISSLNNRFVDTGELSADHYSLYQAEAAWVAGAFSAQTEYIYADVDETGGRQGFNGGYGMLSYFVTGESRPYDKRTGRFGRVKPIENFFLTRGKSNIARSFGGHGRGAWEVASRYSWVDLSSTDVRGGIMENVSVGVNWYWNYNFRMQWNYVHTLRNADDPASISGATDAFIMRMSFDI
jgi:phosphate-selective porin OprO and OprP